MTHLYHSVSVSHDNVTVNQHAQYQDPETEATWWNSVVIKGAIYSFEKEIQTFNIYTMNEKKLQTQSYLSFP